MIIAAVCQSFGILDWCWHSLNSSAIFVSRTSPVFFRRSFVILSSPGSLFSLSCLIACLTSEAVISGISFSPNFGRRTCLLKSL